MNNSPPINDRALIRRPNQVVASEIDGEIVLLNVATGQFSQLNPIGSQIWGALRQPIVLSDLVAEMQVGFEVDAETCRRDVTAFVARLCTDGLLTIDATVD